MNDITKSASKLVLLYIVAILGILALITGIYSVVTQTFGEAAKIILSAFGVALNFILGYYFGYKGDSSQVVKLPSTTEEIEAGDKAVKVQSQFTK